jgi:spermidine synthase
MADEQVEAGAGAPQDLAPDLMTEPMTDDWGFYVRSSRRLEQFRSAYQAVEVHDSVSFGKLFRLDGHFMTSERDEFFYHENLVHLAALSHPSPERALIIGGGDGGSADELFKHPSIRSVTLAEIDASVVDISRKYLGAVHRGALDDPRLTLLIGDGFAFVRTTTERYDLIVLDLTDPGGPSELLYTADFYRACAARLNPLGALTLHIASPVAHPDRIRESLASLRSAFSVVRRLVDDGMRVGNARSGQRFGERDRQQDRRARHRTSAVLQRRHASSRARVAQLRTQPRAVAQTTHICVVDAVVIGK